MQDRVSRSPGQGQGQGHMSVTKHTFAADRHSTERQSCITDDWVKDVCAFGFCRQSRWLTDTITLQHGENRVRSSLKSLQRPSLRQLQQQPLFVEGLFTNIIARLQSDNSTDDSVVWTLKRTVHHIITARRYASAVLAVIVCPVSYTHLTLPTNREV